MKNSDMFLIDFTRKCNSLKNSEDLLNFFGKCKICDSMGWNCMFGEDCPTLKTLVEWLESEAEEEE